MQACTQTISEQCEKVLHGHAQSGGIREKGDINMIPNTHRRCRDTVKLEGGF